MKNRAELAYRALCALLLTLLLACSREEEGGALDETNPSKGILGPIRPSNSNEVTKNTLKRSLVELATKGDTDGSRREFASELRARAKADQVGKMELAAQLVMQSSDEAEIITRMSEIRLSFPSTRDHVDLYKALPGGKFRTYLATAHAGRLSGERDILGLLEFHSALPIGRDRTTVASWAASLTLELDGVDSVIPFIESLEFSDEKYSSLLNILESDKFEGSSLSEVSQAKLIEIANSLRGNQRLSALALLNSSYE